MRRAGRVRGAATLAAFTACAALLVGAGLEPTGCASAVPETPRDLRATSLPQRGVAAHRGASESHPENTLAAIRAAVDGGAHQIEFDVRLSADGALVLVHDRQVDRTTDGRGDVADLTLAELRELDAGAWRGAAFRGERIPTLEEGLAAVPHDRWVNLDVKGGADVGGAAARAVLARGHLDHVLFAVKAEAATAVRAVAPRAWICDMDRSLTRRGYIEGAAERGADFVQLHRLRGTPSPSEVSLAHALGLRVNYCCVQDGEEAVAAWRAGVDFPLTDDLQGALAAGAAQGIEPLPRPHAAR